MKRREGKNEEVKRGQRKKCVRERKREKDKRKQRKNIRVARGKNKEGKMKQNDEVTTM